MAIISSQPVATKVKESVKEKLLGKEEPAQPSAQTKATFTKHARPDEQSGELVMTETEFVDSIAPANEDYVSSYLRTPRRLFVRFANFLRSTKSSGNNMRYSSA